MASELERLSIAKKISSSVFQKISKRPAMAKANDMYIIASARIAPDKAREARFSFALSEPIRSKNNANTIGGAIGIVNMNGANKTASKRRGQTGG